MTATASLDSMLRSYFAAVRAYQLAWLAAGYQSTATVRMLQTRMSRVRGWAVQAAAVAGVDAVELACKLQTVARNAICSCPAVTGGTMPARAAAVAA